MCVQCVLWIAGWFCCCCCSSFNPPCLLARLDMSSQVLVASVCRPTATSTNINLHTCMTHHNLRRKRFHCFHHSCHSLFLLELTNIALNKPASFSSILPLAVSLSVDQRSPEQTSINEHLPQLPRKPREGGGWQLQHLYVPLCFHQQG